MAIASVVERGGWVYVYDERGNNITTIMGGSQPDEGLQGYTASTVSIRRGPWVYVYDQSGNQISTIYAG
jgi:phage pi2 protein 07